MEHSDTEDIDESDKKTVKELKKEKKQAAKEQKKRERLKKKAEKAHAKKVRKAALEELKKDKDELYQLRKNRFLKGVRIFLWSLLMIIFIRGIIVSLRPDQSAEINKTIEDFKTELIAYREQNNEVMAFAENFTYQYLTYRANGESDYVERLKNYAPKSVYNAEIDFDNSSRVVYTQAYKKREYTNKQVDVYVLADVEYTQRVPSEEKDKIIEETERKTTIIKVPIAMENGRYIVESTPLFVNDDVKLSDYQKTDYRGTEVSSEQAEEINESLSNFFAAYYEGEQSVINYFLTPEANKNDFIGLSGRMKFDEITLSRHYLLGDKGSDILSIVTLTINDINDVTMAQNFNLNIIKKDNQYYVKSMNARTNNLNIITGTQEGKNE